MADNTGTHTNTLLHVLINVVFKLFTVILLLSVIVFAGTGILAVSSCLTLSIVLCVSSCVVVYWGKLEALPVHRVKSLLEHETEAIIGHRGGAQEAPENTLASFVEAKRNGAYAVEVDVALTKDGIAVLLHDWTVDRTTNGKGKIVEMTLEQARELDAAAKFSNSSQFSPEKIPTLDECVETCLELDLKIYFDVKDYSDKAVSLLVDLFEKYPRLMDSGIVCSFIPTVIYKVRLRNPEILTALTTSPRFFQTEFKKLKMHLGGWVWPIAYIMDAIMVWSMFNWLWYLCGNSAVLLNKDLISRSVLDYWNARGISVVPWTVNDPGEKKYFLHSCDLAIITDCVRNQQSADATDGGQVN